MSLSVSDWNGKIELTYLKDIMNLFRIKNLQELKLFFDTIY